MYAAIPRDILIVVGDEIIEAPMAWRSRALNTALTGPFSRSTLNEVPNGLLRLSHLLSDNLYDQVNILNFNTFTYPGRFLSGLRNDLELNRS